MLFVKQSDADFVRYKVDWFLVKEEERKLVMNLTIFSHLITSKVLFIIISLVNK